MHSSMSSAEGVLGRAPLGKKGFETPRALTADEIKVTVNDYRTTAVYAKEAGFSGVEVHSANGYLINQFLDSKTNLRTDNYGGSLENRYRFLKKVMAAVLEGTLITNPMGNYLYYGTAHKFSTALRSCRLMPENAPSALDRASPRQAHHGRRQRIVSGIKKPCPINKQGRVLLQLFSSWFYLPFGLG